MDGAVQEWKPDCGVEDSPSLVEQLLREVRELRQETAELRRELADVRRENLELRQQVGYWKAMYARAADRVKVLEAEVEQLRGENRKLQARLFGQKSEQSASRDRSNRLDGENDDQASSPPGARGQRQGRPGPGRRDHKNLPLVEEFHELSEDERVCPSCGVPGNTQRHRGFRTNRDRSPGLSPPNSAMALSADLPLLELSANADCSSSAKIDPQRIAGRLGLG